MILIGQFDSSFVRRVGIALRLYGMDFEHRPWSVFGDRQKVMALNPLGRVPILVIDHDEVLSDSAAILDHLDEAAGDAALIPQAGPERRAALRIVTLAMGVAERAVSLYYSRHLADAPSPLLGRRLADQIASTLSALEADRVARHGAWWFGDAMGHADVAAACAVRHMAHALPDLWDPVAHPALAAHCERAEALPVFQEISQPFVGPAA